MAGSDGLGLLAILKRSSWLRFEVRWSEFRFDATRSGLRFLSCGRPVQLWTMGVPCVVGSDGTVSIVETVCLSPRVETPKLKEGYKSFVPELKKVVCVSGFLCIWTFYISVYFTYLYLAMLHIHRHKNGIKPNHNNLTSVCIFECT